MLAGSEHIDSTSRMPCRRQSTPVRQGNNEGEEKANRNTRPFKNRFNSMKPKEKRFSNRNKKCRFLLPYLPYIGMVCLLWRLRYQQGE